MHPTQPDETRYGDNVQQAEPQSHVESDGEDIGKPIGSLIVSDVDLPLFLLNGTVYVQAPLEDVVDAFATAVAESLRDLESRISEARSAALSLAGLQYSLFGELVALRVMVPRSGERR